MEHTNMKKLFALIKIDFLVDSIHNYVLMTYI